MAVGLMVTVTVLVVRAVRGLKVRPRAHRPHSTVAHRRPRRPARDPVKAPAAGMVRVRRSPATAAVPKGPRGGDEVDPAGMARTPSPRP